MKQDERRQREQVHYVPARLDEQTASMLQALAAERYDGNRSAAIRQAIREAAAKSEAVSVQSR